MGRGGAGYLSYTAFVLLSTASTASAGLWDVDIDEGPAPPPDKGPPFSANATRDRDLLPYQIIGIVGAYVGSILLIGSLLLTVGRSLRKSAQNMAAEPREMVKPLSKTFERSPISPNSAWYSPRRLREKRSAASSMRSGISNQVSPGGESFDHNVIEADRVKREREMERLYAAVMAQNPQRPTGQQETMPLPPPTPDRLERPPEYSRRKNMPKLVTDDRGLRYAQGAGASAGYMNPPLTPKSPVRAIYPPESSLPPGPISPTSPIRAEYPPWAKTSQPDTHASHGRAPSYGSGKATIPSSPGLDPNQKKLRKQVRHLKISAPIIRDDDNNDDRTPLSPRVYDHPGVPPEPPTATTVRSMGYPPTTPGTARSGRGWPEPDDDMDEVRDLPNPNPQRLSAHIYTNQAQIVTNYASNRPDPTRSNRAVGNGTLPLREMNRQYAQQAQYGQASAQSAAFPLSPGHWNPTSPSHAYATSAGPVKTTFVDAQRDRLGAPKTGVPTPYSAYMPFTPVTPVTPHIMSRAERKQREKEEKKVRRAITQEDAVAEEDDLWSSGY